MTTDRGELRDLLREWTAAAAAMTRGLPVPGDSSRPEAPPADTGETEGMAPGLLTVTAGFGPSLFDDRFGLAPRRPALLRDLPSLPGDGLDPGRSGGDLAIQACAQDPQVAFHVIRNLARIGRGVVQMRWSQLGFGRTSATTQHPVDAAQPDGLQGRHPQRPWRRHRPDARARVAAGRLRPGLDDRRQLPGGPADPDAHRGLGPRPAGRPGERLRPGQGRGRAAHRDQGDRRPGLRRHGGRRHPGHPDGRPHPAGRTREQRRPGHAAPRLLLHRRCRPRLGRARRRPVLHRVHARPAGVRPTCRTSSAPSTR